MKELILKRFLLTLVACAITINAFADDTQTVHLCNETINVTFNFKNSEEFQVHSVNEDAKSFELEPSECKDLSFIFYTNTTYDLTKNLIRWDDYNYGGFDVTVNTLADCKTLHDSICPLKFGKSTLASTFEIDYNAPVSVKGKLNVSIADKIEGSYTSTCKNIKYDYTTKTLAADCNKPHDPRFEAEYNHSILDYKTCNGLNVKNNDGNLECDAPITQTAAFPWGKASK